MTKIEIIRRRFAEMGARLLFQARPENDQVRFNVRSDRKGEFFEIEAPPEAEFSVVAADPKGRHLVLVAQPAPPEFPLDILPFLCGKDERHWFVTLLPTRVPASVREAKQALKPAPVRDLESKLKVASRMHRRNAASIRQGEWFFIPCPGLQVDGRLVRVKQTLYRDLYPGPRRVNPGTHLEKPHWVQFLYRKYGRMSWVPDFGGPVLGEEEFALLPKSLRKSGGYRAWRRDLEVYAKGWVRHPDHATVMLTHWHRVQLNNERRTWGIFSAAD
jgi:hypothetical protein